MKTISNDYVIYSFKPQMEPVEKVKVKEVFKVKTNDCFYGQIEREDQTLDEIDYSKLNPTTGPIYIEGAEPGDVLKIKILDINVDSKGVALTLPSEGVLKDKSTKSLTKILDIKDEMCCFQGLLIPIDPMIGVIGVAPSQEEGEYNTATPWKHGGNMDTTDIRVGSTVYLGVNEEGGLLALGDCHAIMGDGEVSFSGLEVAAEVTLEVDLIKKKEIIWPLVETKNHTMVISSGDTVDEAMGFATNEAVRYLMKGLDISWEEAYLLSSLVMDLKISQVVDPKKTVRAAIPKTVLVTEKLLRSL